MKNRDYKDFAEGSIVHAYNRGNNKEKIFLDNQDHRAFLFRLGLALGFTEEDLNKEALTSLPYSRIRITTTGKNNYKLHAFCLMPNHFHLLVEQIGDISISNLILKVCTSYSKYFNKKYKRVGHVFQDQFKSVLVESNPQLMWLSSYIHMNPVKDGIVKHPSKHTWSSYNDFCGERNTLFITKEFLLETFGSKDDFIQQTLSFESKQ